MADRAAEAARSGMIPGAMATPQAEPPRLLVLSSLFPSPEEPIAGVFVRERMFRVARQLPVAVVAPVSWFPFQHLLRFLRPHFRLTRAVDSIDEGVHVLRPRYLSVPGPILLDGIGMAAGAAAAVGRLVRGGGSWIIDAHFAYPDGYAASLLARRYGLPYTITLRGTELRHSRKALVRIQMARALTGARRVFAVSASLAGLARDLGVPAQRVVVVPNGVDLQRHQPVERGLARQRLGLPAGARVLVTVGGLVRRKGFHRVIARLPRLRARWGEVIYLAVGGASREGDDSQSLQELARSHGVAEHVRFLGALAPDDVRLPLSAADVMVLPSSNEGWANVLLESMACGTPVVASDVGGNREVVADPAVGIVFDLGDEAALDAALDQALVTRWDAAVIRAYAQRNSWDARVDQLVREFTAIAAGGRGTPGSAAA